MRTLSEPTGLGSLSEIQRQNLRLYIRLGSYKAVAYERGVALWTVRNEVRTILRRLNVDTLVQACILLDRAER